MSKTKKDNRNFPAKKTSFMKLPNTANTILAIIASIVAIISFVFYTFPESTLYKNIWYQCNFVDKNRIAIIVTQFSGDNSEMDERIYRALQDRINSMNLKDSVQILKFDYITPKTTEEAEEIAKKCNASIVIWGIGDLLGVDIFHTKLNSNDLISLSTELPIATPELDDSIPYLENLKYYILTDVPQQYEYLMLMTVAQIAIITNEPSIALPILDEAIELGESLLQPLQEYQDIIETNQVNLCLECAYFNRANANYFSGNYEEALDDFSRILINDPADIESLHNSGDVYFALNRLDDALIAYNKTIELHEIYGVNHPVIAFSYNNRGVVHEQLSEYELAFSDYWSAINLNNEYAVPYFNLAGLHKKKGDLPLALQMIDTAIDIDPNYINALFRSGQYRYESKDYTRAINDYKKIIDLGHGSAVVYYERGNAYDEMKYYSLAIADYKTAIALSPNYFEAHNNLGLSIMKQGKYEESIVHYENAIKINNQFPAPYFNEARAYELMGKYELSIQVLDRALLAGIDPIQVHLVRARINIGFKYYKLALEDYKFILENINPNDPLYQNTIENIQELEKIIKE